MKRLTLFAAFCFLAGPAVATPQAAAAAIATIGDLGQLNGQALACGEMATAGEAKKLVIRHAPKSRHYGEAFEEQTNAAFLAQGQKGQAPCPSAATFASRLGELSSRLQTLLPATQAAGQ